MAQIETKLCVKGQIVKNLGANRDRWVLWHVTGRCNIECPYCYGSFNGGSYKADYSKADDVPLTALKTAASDLKKLGFNRVHINGGEPILRSDILEFLRYLKIIDMRVWFLTNATTQLHKIERIIDEGLVELLAISIDAKDAATIDRQRERGEVVLKNLSRIVEHRDKAGNTLKIGAYCVATKFSAGKIPELLDYLIEMGLDYFNVQPMYLPEGHPFRAASLTTEDISIVKEYSNQIRKRARDIEISTDSNLSLAEIALETPAGLLSAKDCFAQHGKYLFIGPRGDVLGCPSIPQDQNKSLGNITTGRITDMIGHVDNGHERTCKHLSMDCLGMYEMAYRDD